MKYKQASAGKTDGETDRIASDDDVYPLHEFDADPRRRVFVVRVMRFNDILDAEMLCASLSRLLEIGDWRKLGGRLKHNKNDTLEVHVPKQYTDERPALTFTHDKFFDMDVEQHPEARHLHHPTAGSSIQHAADHHPPFASRADFPKTVDEMIRLGLPQLLLHVTSFKNATLVSLMWPHTVADATGIMQLFRNWSLVLANRVEEVQSLLGARNDILLEAENGEAEDEREELKLLPKRLTGLKMVSWALQHAWHHFWSPALQTKTVFLTKEALRQLRSQTQQEIEKMPLVGSKTNFASENDMLTAWATQIVASSEPRAKPMSVLTILNVRPMISQVINSGGLHIQNMTIMTYTFLSKKLLSGPTGPIAVSHRRQFQEQSGSKQVLSFLRILRQDLRKGRLLSHLFGELDSRPMIFNNLIKAEFLKAADFSPAVVRDGDGPQQRINPRGTAIGYYYRVYNTPLDDFTTFFMLCKDHGGNCWLQGNLRPAAWAEMQKRLDKLTE